jgi:uncharacterized protein (DUF1778 family)
MGATAKKGHTDERSKNMPAATERLEARVPREQKQLFQRAAELRGLTLTDFVIGTLQQAALQTVEDHNVIRLAVEDQRTFVDALMSPPAPNKALQKAAERYRRTVAR